MKKVVHHTFPGKNLTSTQWSSDYYYLNVLLGLVYHEKNESISKEKFIIIISFVEMSIFHGETLQINPFAMVTVKVISVLCTKVISIHWLLL